MTAAPLFFSQRMATLAQTHANHPALIDRDSPLTFAVLHQQTGQLAGNLAAIGLKPHERVAVWLPNCAAWVQTFLACAHLGATVLAVNTRFRSQEVADIIGRGKADWLVLWPAFKGIAFADMLADISQDVLARLRGIIAVGKENDPSMTAITARGHRLHAFTTLLQRPSPTPPAFGHAPALCFTTSGTTAAPKFVLHDQKTLIGHADSMQQAFQYDQASRILVGAPFCGTFGFSTLTGGLATGSTVVCEPVSDTTSTLEQIRKHRITHTYANNESLLKLFEAAPSPATFTSCKLFGFANFSPAVTTLLEQAERNGVSLTGLYGSSELQALMAAQPRDASQGDVSVRYLPGGRLIHPDARVRVRDPATGQIAAHGESGEIEIKCQSQLLNYLDDPDATAQAFTPDVFFKTGDLGYTVSDHQFIFQTRMGDSMRLSGFLVNPAEIEQAIEALPEIQACQVVGATQGTKILPVAFVLLKPGTQADPTAWMTECKRTMAGYKVPVRFEVLTEFPTIQSANAAKIQKNKLRDLAGELLARQV